MKKLGFIGLGFMGSAMAANLVRAGFSVAANETFKRPWGWVSATRISPPFTRP